MTEFLTFSPRALRYFVAIMIVVTGVVVGAVINSSAGGTACAALAVMGCVALMRMIVVDVGWSGRDDGGGRRDGE